MQFCKYACPLCEKQFRHQQSLIRHKIQVHNQMTRRNSNVKCPNSDCTATFSQRKLLRDHIISKHDIPLEMQVYRFSTFKEFLLWKQAMEKETNSLYYSHQSPKTLVSNNKVCYYSCHRTGFYSPSGLSQLKMTSSSKKINGCCPSTIDVIVSASEVTATFWKSHYGHAIEKASPRVFVSQIEFADNGRETLNEKVEDEGDETSDAIKELLQLTTHSETIEEGLPAKTKEKKKSQMLGRCPCCSRLYHSVFYLKIHMNQQHGVKYINPDCEEYCIKCGYDPLCLATFSKLVHYRQHLVLDHDVSLQRASLTFSTSNEFLMWKSKEEQTCEAKFISPASAVETKSGVKKQTFSCTWSKSSIVKGKDDKPPTKVNTLCPAKMDLYSNNGKYVLSYYKTHIGHEKVQCPVPLEDETHVGEETIPVAQQMQTEKARLKSMYQIRKVALKRKLDQFIKNLILDRYNLKFVSKVLKYFDTFFKPGFELTNVSKLFEKEENSVEISNKYLNHAKPISTTVNVPSTYLMNTADPSKLISTNLVQPSITPVPANTAQTQTLFTIPQLVQLTTPSSCKSVPLNNTLPVSAIQSNLKTSVGNSSVLTSSKDGTLFKLENGILIPISSNDISNPVSNNQLANQYLLSGNSLIPLNATISQSSNILAAPASSSSPYPQLITIPGDIGKPVCSNEISPVPLVTNASSSTISNQSKSETSHTNLLVGSGVIETKAKYQSSKSIESPEVNASKSPANINSSTITLDNIKKSLQKQNNSCCNISFVSLDNTKSLSSKCILSSSRLRPMFILKNNVLSPIHSISKSILSQSLNEDLALKSNVPAFVSKKKSESNKKSIQFGKLNSSNVKHKANLNVKSRISSREVSAKQAKLKIDKTSKKLSTPSSSKINKSVSKPTIISIKNPASENSKMSGANQSNKNAALKSCERTSAKRKHLTESSDEDDENSSSSPSSAVMVINNVFSLDPNSMEASSDSDLCSNTEEQ